MLYKNRNHKIWVKVGYNFIKKNMYIYMYVYLYSSTVHCCPCIVYDAMYFWVWYNYGCVESKRKWNKKNVQKLKQTTELSKLKSIKMHALFEHLFWGLSEKKQSSYNNTSMLQFQFALFCAVVYLKKLCQVSTFLIN